MVFCYRITFLIRACRTNSQCEMKIENLFENSVDRNIVLYYYYKQENERMFAEGEKYGK